MREGAAPANGAPIDVGLSGEGNSLVARCARFDSADRLHPWQVGQKKSYASRPVRLLVRMPAFQAGESGSIPERVTKHFKLDW